MSIEMVLYSIDVLNNIGVILGTLIACFAMLGGAAALISLGVLMSCGEDSIQSDHARKTLNVVKSYFGWFILIILISSLVPSEKTMYLMLGADYLKNSTLPSKVELALEKKIDKYLEETEEKK